MEWMILPVLATAVIVLTLGWFGLHVLQRGVIFVDLALAQVAALGTTLAVFFGHEANSGAAFALSLVFTFIGAAAFSAARLFESRVPQEAIIGIAYAVSAATGILMIHFADDPHGGEELEHLLVGNIVWVQPAELMLLAGACGAVGLFHLIFRERFFQISFRPEEAVAQGRNLALWDLWFYLSFGFALTAIVSVSGVLLVFSYLVIPAVIARLLVNNTRARLLLAWGVGLAVSVAGVAISYEHPTGPVIVSLFGALLLVVLAGYAIARSASRLKMAGSIAGIVAVIVATIWGFSRIPTAGHEHEHEHEELAEASPIEAEPLRAADAGTRDAAAREAAGRPDRASALSEALAVETDDAVKLTMAVALAQGDRRGLSALAALCASETPFVRMEADSRLRALAGEAAPTYDPLSGPDTAGVWAAWVQGLSALPEGAAGLALP